MNSQQELSSRIQAALAQDPGRGVIHILDSAPITAGELALLAEDFQKRCTKVGLSAGDAVLIALLRRHWPLFAAAFAGSHLAGLRPAFAPADAGTDATDAVRAVVPVRAMVSSRSGPAASWDSCDFTTLSPPPRLMVEPPGTVEYLLTSGTEGAYKPVAVSADARLAQSLTGNRRERPRVTAVVAPPGTNTAQTVLAEALVNPYGAIACLERWSPEAFLRLVESSQATAAVLAPAMVGALLRAKSFAPERLASLRVLRLGMAPATSELVDSVGECLPWLTVVNIYTTTEAWPAGTLMRHGQDRAGTVGRPLPGTVIRVVDDEGRSLPAGTPGRILLAYQPAADLPSAECDTPPDGWPGWTDTGDVGHLDADGQLTLLGRSSDLVTRTGLTVSLVAVERAILRSGLALDAGAFQLTDVQGGTVLAAAVEWAAEPAEAELRAFLLTALGTDRTPTVLRTVEALPRDAQGKLRRAVLASAFQAPAAAGAAAAPRAMDSIAGQLEPLWCEALMRDTVSPSDGFLEVGGDSMSAVILNALISEHMGIEIPLADQFGAETFGDLVNLVRSCANNQGG